MSGKESERSKKLREKIEREMEIKREEHRQQMLKRRIEVARLGIKAFENKKFLEAAQQFLTYIKILEDWKKVPSGSLSPVLFDARSDAAELLLISMVYWHLVRMLDNSPAGSQQEREFLAYLRQYIVFSKGMTFQPLNSETLRKHLRTHKMVHTKELKEAYKELSGSKCFVATSLIDVIDEGTIGRLQRYRDRKLSASGPGRMFIRLYYRLGPWMAVGVDRLPRAARVSIARGLDRLSLSLSGDR